ncbi:MAG: sulfur carrier protein ThiS [Chitinophagales bacterium]
MMQTVFVNKEALEIADHTSLQQVIEKVLTEIDGIAIALNENIIPKDDWQTTILNDKDDIIIIGAVAGG